MARSTAATSDERQPTEGLTEGSAELLAAQPCSGVRTMAISEVSSASILVEHLVELGAGRGVEQGPRRGLLLVLLFLGLTGLGRRPWP